MSRLLLAFRSLVFERGGNVAISAALLLPVLMAAAAIVVDEASLYYQKRQMQAAVDLAAMQVVADPDNALSVAHQVLLDHKLVDPATPLVALADPVSGPLKVVTGRYTPDPNLPVGARFVEGATPPNAADVRYRMTGNIHFARAFLQNGPEIGVEALASATPRAGFSVGSRLASLDGGVVNHLLGQLLGTELSLDLADYNALANLDISLLSFLDALAGEVGLSAGTYGDVLDASVKLADIAVGLAAASGGSNPTAVDLLLDLAGIIDDSITVDMLRVIAADGLADVALGTPQAGGSVGVNALELLTVAALLADGERQAQLGLGLGLPGIAGVSVQLVVGEPPQAAWYTFGEAGSFVRTAQVRLKIDFSVLGSGGAGIGLLSIGLPVYAEVAFAEAHLASLTCPAGRPDLGQASLAVRPGVLRLAVGSIPPGSFLDTTRPLTISRSAIVNVLGIAQVTAKADIASAQINPHVVYFNHADVLNRTVKTVSTSTPLTSLTSSLLSNLDLRLELLGLNLLGGLLNGVVGTVANLLAPVGPALDTVLTSIFGVLGLSIGEADVRMHGFDCRAAALVR